MMSGVEVRRPRWGFALGTETNPQMIQRADLDADGSPTILDLQRLVNLLLGA